MAFNKEDIIKLTVAVYQVTAKFPENEALQQKIREKANEILADFVCYPQGVENSRIGREIEVISALFSVAEAQNWVNKKNFEVLAREYRKVRDFTESLSSVIKKEGLEQPEKVQKPLKIAKKPVIAEKISQFRSSFGPTDRQQKIIRIIESKGQVSLAELKGVFSQLSPRTLRRDLRALAEKDVVERIRAGKENISFVLKGGSDSGQIMDSGL